MKSAPQKKQQNFTNEAIRKGAEKMSPTVTYLVEEIRELEVFVRPRSVAVVGASKTPGKVGHTIMRNVLESGYPGKVFPINPKEEEIMGLRCYPTVREVGEPIDLVIVAVPAAVVLRVAEECGQTGVKGLIVISAGFKEAGREGFRLEKELVEICRRYGMRLVGPNCLGVMDTHTPLNASFAPKMPHQGEIAFISQSGALGTAILDWSLAKGIGFSKFISMGNKGDLNENDFIALAAEDPDTKVILAYIESVTDGERFMEVTRAATRKKPVIILKSGTSEAGARAASSHTGALAGNDRMYDTVFKQCGVLRARSIQELFDLASTFVTQPVPPGRKTVILTNAGGPGILAADRVEATGLTMARLRKETVEALRERLPEEASLYNPVDVIGDARADRYAFALEKILNDPNVDNIVVILTPQGMTEPLATAEAIIRLHQTHPEKPLVTSFVGGEVVEPGVRRLLEAGIPCFPFPEAAVSSLAVLVEYAERRKRPEGKTEFSFDVNQERVREIFRAVRADQRQMLLGSEAGQVVEAYGIRTAPSYLARTPQEAVRYAEELGYPVALKLAAPKVQHKTDLGGVHLNIKTAAQVEEHFEAILHSLRQKMPGAEAYGVEVQKMLPMGRELIIGMVRDHQFGPMLMFGLGGIYVNLFKDVAFRAVYGLTREEVEAMMRETKAYLLLRGVRGEHPADIPALVEVLLRVAKLVADFPEITELDINPLFAYEKGVAAVDVKITIGGE